MPEAAESFRMQHGGEQEHGHRAGTEDFPAIAAMVAALTEAEAKKTLNETERARWRDAFERAVPERARLLAPRPRRGAGRLDASLAAAILYAPSWTLRGGTREILRGIIARGLGLR